MFVRIVVSLLFSSVLVVDSPAQPLQPAQPAEKAKPDVGFVPTPQPVVESMLQTAKVGNKDVLYDLGCGDGRLVILAAKQYGARAIGIDIDPERITEAKQNATAAGVEAKVDFRQANIFESDFKDASVITLYLLNELNVRLRPRIFAQVKPGTRIVSHAFRMGDWEPDLERPVEVQTSTYNTFFWVVPATMSGRWKVTAKAAGKEMPQEVVIEQTFQKVTVRAGDGAEPLAEGRLTGNDFTLTLNASSGGKPAQFTGTITGNKIVATDAEKREAWRAEREAGSEKPIEPPGPLNAGS